MLQAQPRNLNCLQRLLCTAVFISRDSANARFDEVEMSFSTNFLLPTKRANVLVDSGRQQLNAMVQDEFGEMSIDGADDMTTAVLAVIRTSQFHRSIFGYPVGNALENFITNGDLLDLYLGFHFYSQTDPGIDIARALSFVQNTCFAPMKEALQNNMTSDDTILQDEPVQIPCKRPFTQVSGTVKVSRKKQASSVDEENANPISRHLHKRRFTPSPRKKRPDALTHALEPAKDNSHVKVEVQDLQGQFVNVVPEFYDAPELMFMDVDMPFINEDLATSASHQSESLTLSWTASEHDDTFESQARDYELLGSAQALEEYQPKDDDFEKVSLIVEARQDIDELPDGNGRFVHTDMVEQSIIHTPSSSADDQPSVVPSVFLFTKTHIHSQGLTLSTHPFPRQASLTPRLPTNVFLPSDSYLAAQGIPLASRIALPTSASPLTEAGRDSEPSAQVTACTPSSKTKSTSFKTRFLSFVTRTLRFMVATFAVYCLFLIFSSWQERLNLQLHVLLFIKALAIVYSLVSTIIEFFYTKQSLSYSLLKSCMVAILSTTFAIESLLLVYAIIDILAQKDPFAFVIPSRLKIGHK
ncbi:hypothetical protein EV360DRAFT_83417 [Lentinula raphanica]|nr:hypothetical protein EV360DRAFT_83417 [Lentinula raphanica]